MKLPRLLAAACAAACFAPVCATASTLAQVNSALQAGEADHAIALLQSLPAPLVNSAQAYNLACRVQFSLRNVDAAVQQCEQAVALDDQNSEDHLWLGRTLGLKASRASFLTAYALAKRVRTEFERAAQLDPRNASALSDLGDYYAAAPGIVGGGTDKATAVAAQLDRLDRARAAVLRARIAEKNGDYGTAEREYKEAIALAPHPGPQWVALAVFYRRRQRWEDMEAAIRSCNAVALHDWNSGAALYDAASILMETNRNPVLAVAMMKAYLADPGKTEEGPAFEAYLRLARLQQRLGDADDAVRDRTQALALAHTYRRAQESGD